MLKRLRWRFIGIATLSMALVLLLLIVGINFSFRVRNDRNADIMLRLIAEHEGNIPPYSDEMEPRQFGRPVMSPETPYETRFFVVRVDAGGQVTSSQMEHIFSVTQDTVDEYLRQAMGSEKENGYVGQYRYYRCTDGDQTLYIFLDCFRNQNMARALLWISFGLAFLVLAGAGLVLFLLSKRAIAPMVKSVERQQRFITDASHEIKTPVTVIGSYAALMVMEDPDNEWARTIEKETGRLSSLVTDLVKLSRWDEEGPMVDKERFSLSEAVWDLLPTYQKLSASNGHAVEADIREDVFVEGDEGAVQNAVSVLLENAVKYAVPDSAISVKLDVRRKTALLCVTNACDLPPEIDPERLFDRFYRADPSRTRSSGGNGVGLSLARAIVEAHKGTIRARRDDHRITFEITLPMSKASD